MTPKRKKGNTQQNGSSTLDKNQPNLVDTEIALGPAPPGTTNYQEIHKDEADALRSIYADDFEDVESKPSAWHVSAMRRPQPSLVLGIPNIPSLPRLFVVLCRILRCHCVLSSKPRI